MPREARVSQKPARRLRAPVIGPTRPNGGKGFADPLAAAGLDQVRASASARVSKMCGARPRSAMAEPNLARRKVLVV